jgi:hypothetical protein
MPVPRDRVERALVEALNKGGLTDLRTVAASVGLSSTRRFYKDFRNLRLAVVAKNREIRKQRVHRPQKYFASLGPSLVLHTDPKVNIANGGSMGSDANVYVFDHGRYLSDVIPALRRLLLTGELEPWLGSIMNQRSGRTFAPGLFRDTDLLQYCTYLTADFAPEDFSAISEIHRPHVQGWGTRACPSEECPARSNCPFHKSAPQAVVEELHYVIEAAVASRCLDATPLHSLFVGRTMNAADYTELLDHLNVPSDHSVRVLLKKLCIRGFVIGYQWTLSGDGIHGWLDPDETSQLLSDLRQLPLPNYEPTLEAVQSLLKASQAGDEAFRKDEGIKKRIVFRAVPGSTVQHGLHAPEDQEKLAILHRDWLALSLSFVRTIATVAQGQAMGLLWGNSVSWTSQRA